MEPSCFKRAKCPIDRRKPDFNRKRIQVFYLKCYEPNKEDVCTYMSIYLLLKFYFYNFFRFFLVSPKQHYMLYEHFVRALGVRTERINCRLKWTNSDCLWTTRPHSMPNTRVTCLPFAALMVVIYFGLGDWVQLSIIDGRTKMGTL